MTLALSTQTFNKIKASNSILLDNESKIFFFIVLVSQLFFQNGFYLFISTAFLFGAIYFLQKPFKPAVFTFIAFQHILQIIAGVWQATYAEKGLNFRSLETTTATIASLLGVAFLLFPVIRYQNKLPVITLNDLKHSASKLSTDKTLSLYIASFFLTSFLASIAWSTSAGGYSQSIYNILKIKWIFFLLFGYQSILKNQRRQIFYLCIFLEFVTGFYSYFSDFKTVVYYLIVLLLTLLSVVNFKKLILGIILGSFLFFFAILWTGIKGNYRNFLNSGKRQQTVTVTQDEALNKLYDLSSDVDEEKFNSSIYQFLDRLQYTYHFAKTIERVPAIIPHTNGQNWLDNIEFVTTPRILNPDKPKVDATEKTKKYTGIRYAGAKKGTSFSLGYFAECYIDFGLWGMMIPLLLLGIFYTKIYAYFMKKSSLNFIFNYTVVTVLFMDFYAFETDGIILLGKFLSSLITFYLFLKLLFPPILRYIKSPDLESDKK